MKEEKILINNLEINYKITGEGNPLLILHGWEGSSNSWVEVQKFLTGQGFKVIVPDLPGFGKSVSPSASWGVEDYGNFVLNFIEKMRLKEVILMGHSFGGRIAIKLTSENSDKFKKLILCSSAGIKHNLNFRQRTLFNLARVGSFLFSKKVLRRYRDVATNILYLIFRRADYGKVKGVMKGTFKKIIIEDLEPNLSKIKIKTLIVWGERDKTVPLKDAYLMKNKIPQSVLEVILKTGHSPNLEEPKKLAEIILKFLRE